VHPVERFQMLLKRERNRSDRCGQRFSILIFNVGSFYYDHSLIRSFIGILKKNIRVTDDIGWFDHQSIAVILPETDKDGGSILLEKIIRLSQSVIPQIDYRFYTYPSKKCLTEQEEVILLPHVDLQTKMAVGYTMPLWKRSIDIIGSFFGLILLSPLFFIVACIIKSVSPQGTVFFRQERVGRGGKMFRMFKFRTMRNNNDQTIHRNHLIELIHQDENNNTIPMEKLKDDARIIPFGNFLRKSCIDELPQLINVLLGDMSLVGPRPCIPYEAGEYLRWHSRRFDITPGMTGLWQVNGKNTISFKDMVRLDIQYAMQRSFSLDTYIILKTPWVIFNQILDRETTYTIQAKSKTILKKEHLIALEQTK